MSTAWRAIIIAVCLAVLAIELWGFRVLSRNSTSLDWAVTTFLLIGGLAVLASCLYLIVMTFTWRLLLFANRIECRELTTYRAFQRDQIRGWRCATQHSPYRLVFEWKDTSRKAANVLLVFERDNHFLQWMEGLENLDAREAASEMESIINDPALGHSARENAKVLLDAKALARGLNLLTIALAVWPLVYPHPYPFLIAVLLASPWISAFVAWRSKGLICVVGNPVGVRPQLTLFTVLPPLILPLLALARFGNSLVGWRPAVLSTVSLAAVLIVALYNADKAIRKEWLSIFLVTALPYGYGSAIHLNLVGEIEPVRYDTYKVTGKKITNDRHHDLFLTPAGLTFSKLNSIRVSRETYNSVSAGTSICLTVHRGALGIQWIVPMPPSSRCP